MLKVRRQTAARPRHVCFCNQTLNSVLLARRIERTVTQEVDFHMHVRLHGLTGSHSQKLVALQNKTPCANVRLYKADMSNSRPAHEIISYVCY